MSKGLPFPRTMSRSFLSTKKIIRDWAERSEMVYFGFVSQRNDEHQIVRGLTVSTKHTDDHYCIGTFESYDTVFVERSDTLLNGKKHVWHIMAFDLKLNKDRPHTFISSSNRDKGFHELLQLKYPHLQRIVVGATAAYPEQFSSDFEVYTTPADQVEVESVITPETAAILASHFRGLVIELSGTTLYVYSEKNHITPALLDTMVQNGVWLAKALDT